MQQIELKFKLIISETTGMDGWKTYKKQRWIYNYYEPNYDTDLVINQDGEESPFMINPTLTMFNLKDK